MAKKPSEWKALLIALLQEANTSTHLAALKWLSTHMDEYLERFSGFVELGTVPIGKIVESDLFVIVRVAIDVIEQQLLEEPQINSSIQKQWSEFQNAVSWMQMNQDSSDIRLILDTYYRFKISLLALKE